MAKLHSSPSRCRLAVALFQTVQADAVAFGVLEECDEAMLAGGEFGLHHRAASRRNSLEHTVEIALHVKIDNRAARAGSDVFAAASSPRHCAKDSGRSWVASHGTTR